ncbi:MAG TPA: cytochrome c [Pyrinomonadaceae bacterium]|jgi:mono/diheme cytochrome c family protein|nr:cytochrome c [Pyrinomonadaceae bacterium]
MITRSLFVASVLLIAITAGCKTNQTTSPTTNSHPAASSTPDQFATIRPTYDKECKRCHGDTGEGGPVKLDDGTKLKVPSLRDNRAARHPDSDYLKQIQKGGDGMPDFGKKLTDDQMNDLIKMIRAEFQGK